MFTAMDREEDPKIPSPQTLAVSLLYKVYTTLRDYPGVATPLKNDPKLAAILEKGKEVPNAESMLSLLTSVTQRLQQFPVKFDTVEGFTAPAFSSHEPQAEHTRALSKEGVLPILTKALESCNIPGVEFQEIRTAGSRGSDDFHGIKCIFTQQGAEQLKNPHVIEALTDAMLAPRAHIQKLHAQEAAHTNGNGRI